MPLRRPVGGLQAGLNLADWLTQFDPLSDSCYDARSNACMVRALICSFVRWCPYFFLPFRHGCHPSVCFGSSRCDHVLGGRLQLFPLMLAARRHASITERIFRNSEDAQEQVDRRFLAFYGLLAPVERLVRCLRTSSTCFSEVALCPPAQYPHIKRLGLLINDRLALLYHRKDSLHLTERPSKVVALPARMRCWMWVQSLTVSH